MAFNLPKAWSPSFAYPKNVLDEGLERHAFVTLEAPDGTYDNPAVGDGGFAVPQYVLDEGYGQGSYITAWAPRGTYFGKKIPYWLNQAGNVIKSEKRVRGGVQYTLQNQPTPPAPPHLLDPPLPEPYHSFGQRAAAHVLGWIKQVAPKHRKTQLTKALGKVDPTLWSRTQGFTQRYIARGVPPAAALHQGLARAMSTGMAAEIVTTGKNGGAKKRSVGGYLGALGAIPAGAASGASAISTTAPAPTGLHAPDTTQTGGQVQIGPFVLPELPHPQTVNINGIDYPSIYMLRVTDPSYISSDWQGFLHNVMTTSFVDPHTGAVASQGNYWNNDTMGGGAVTVNFVPSPSGGFVPVASKTPPGWASEPVTEASYRAWVTALGIGPNENYNRLMLPIWGTGVLPLDQVPWSGGLPVATFKHPDYVGTPQEMWGAWLALEKIGTTTVGTKKPPGCGYFDICEAAPVPGGGTNAPMGLRVVFAPVQVADSLRPASGSLLSIFNPMTWIGYISQIIYRDVIKPIVDGVSGIACDVLKQLKPGQVPPGYVGTAAQLAQLVSGCFAPPPPAPTVAKSNWETYVIVGGAALGLFAIYQATRKKKAKAT